MDLGTPTQTPALQASSVVHSLPSLQAVPLARSVVTHWLACSSHVPLLHCSLQSRWLPATQTPDWHLSPTVQYSLSEQKVPFGRLTTEHVPSGLHCPRTHSPSSWEQEKGVPWQAPCTHWSCLVQTSPSVQEVPSVTGGFEHTPTAQLSSVQTLLSEQLLQATPPSPQDAAV